MTARFLTILCVLFAAFVLYGSLMPFDLRADGPAAQVRFARAWTMWPFGPRHASRTDILANVALYVPLGLLLATRLRLAGVHALLAVAAAVEAALALSMTVEGLQLLSETRVSQGTDLVTNAVGGLLGGLVGAAVGPRVLGALLRSAQQRAADRPLALAAWALALLLAADTVFPFLPSLDVGDVLYGLRALRLPPAAAFARRPWHHWAAHGAAYAALAGLCAASLRRRPRRGLRAVLLASAFALACEVSRLFFVASSPSAVRLAAAVGGSTVGGAGAAMLAGRLSPRAQRAAAVALLAAALAYAQWTPPAAGGPTPSGRPSAAAAWVPFYRYAQAGTPEDLRGFLHAAVLAAALTFAALWPAGQRPRRHPVLWSIILAAALGATLAAGRLLLAAPHLSTTEPLCIILGGALGGWLTKVVACYLPSSSAAAAPAGRAPAGAP